MPRKGNSPESPSIRPTLASDLGSYNDLFAESMNRIKSLYLKINVSSIPVTDVADPWIATKFGEGRAAYMRPASRFLLRLDTFRATGSRR